MSTPLVSVVTPSFEQADFLIDNLDSVKSQTYPNVEHIVVDGGSTDGTVDILREYEDEYNLVWSSEPDEGQSNAINKGFDLAIGEYVGWLNSDDIYFDERVLERICGHFERTDADVIYGDLAYVDGDSRVTQIDVRPDFDAEKLLYRILIGQPATFFRQAVVQNNRLDTTLDYCMDYEFWIRLSQQYDIQHLNDVLAGFRVHEAQKTDDMETTSTEVEEMLSRYYESQRDWSGLGVVVDNAETEVSRTLASIHTTYRLHRERPTLAFDGSFASLPEMLANVGPSTHDVRKALRRWL